MPFASDPRRSPDRTTDALIRYGGAVVIVLAAAAVRWMLQPALGVAPPYITFYLAVVAASAFGGLGPGVVATLLGGVLGVGLANWPARAWSWTRWPSRCACCCTCSVALPSR